MALPTRVERGNQDMFELAQRDFDSILGRLVSGRMGDGASNSLAPYGVDIREDADHFYVEAEMPGFKKEDIDISMENQMLTIIAERKEKKDEKNQGDMLLHERRYSRFQRSFTLPPNVDAKTVKATLADGLLNIVLEKREETKPRKIAVS